MTDLGAWVRESLRAQLWPLPIFAVIVAVLAGELLPRLDGHADASLPGWLSHSIFGGDPDAARTVLSAVSGSLITVTSLTFSLTVVTLQLASSQFSPRLLRTFTRDMFVQATLAIFLATFTYSLTVLRVVRSDSDGQSPFVPRLSVTFAYLLAVASVVGLVFFLAHLVRQIRVETMLRNVHTETTGTLDAVLEKRPDHPAGPPPVPPADASVLLAPSSGFFVSVEEAPLLATASTTATVIQLDALPGDSLVLGTPFGRAWRPAGGGLGAEDRQQLDRAVEQAVKTGPERTGAQDIGYGLRQLTDVANKALSPGINDPTTAVHALGHISALLGDLCDRKLGPVVLRDDDSAIRVVLNRPDLAHLLDVAVTQPRRYGAADPQVMARLFRLLTELAWRVYPDSRHLITSQLDRLVATVRAQDFDPTEQAQLKDAERRVRDAVTAAASSTPRGAR